ncbi:hypothetical protein B296_00034609 [Ensete ventricosum]|uniref:Uncharacterized protein n=1 Tax=Ensete ventricosum TaxID=4639 RepID=A0A426YBN3_ENSVE|nr:hypothetical protein B296_00034609 [Ensete ventricosum]
MQCRGLARTETNACFGLFAANLCREWQSNSSSTERRCRRRSLIPFRRYIAEQRGNIRRQSTVRMVFFGIWMRLFDRDRLQRVRNHTSHLDLGTVERRREKKKKKKAARERNHKDWWSQR